MACRQDARQRTGPVKAQICAIFIWRDCSAAPWSISIGPNKACNPPRSRNYARPLPSNAGASGAGGRGAGGRFRFVGSVSIAVPKSSLLRTFAIVKIPPGATFSYDGSDADIRLRRDLDHLNFSGAKSPYQPEKESTGSPNSAKVGISEACAMRLSLVTT
jgi:hypothetical protein